MAALPLALSTVTLPSRASVFSWITTVSAPRGSGAPVKIRTASPVPFRRRRHARRAPCRSPSTSSRDARRRRRERHSRPSPTHRKAVASVTRRVAQPACDRWRLRSGPGGPHRRSAAERTGSARHQRKGALRVSHRPARSRFFRRPFQEAEWPRSSCPGRLPSPCRRS